MLQVILMLRLSLPEGTGGGDFRHHFAGPQAGSVDIGDCVFSDAHLFLVHVEDGRPIAGAQVIALPVASGWIVDLEEEFEQRAIARDRRVESDLDRLRMNTVIVVGGVRNVAAGIANARLDHAGHLSDQILHAPEAAACQNRPFRLHCHVTTSQLKALADVVLSALGIKMRIATFNINNIRRRLPNLLGWMRETSPDVVCLQELKATGAEFPVAAIRDAGYEAIWRGQKTWNGVAILSRRKPIQTLSDLPGDPNDKQSRYVEAAVNGIVVASLYAPNGSPQPGPKFDYKLAWLCRLSVHAAELLAARVPAVLAGDYNVVPTERDIYPSKSWDKDALVQPASRAAFAELTKQGWVDAARALHPSEPMYTFWHYLRNRWQRDAGLRIDHVLLSPVAADCLQAAGVDRVVRGQPDASDHAPVWVELSDQNGRRRRPRARGLPGRGQTALRPTRPSRSRPLLVIDGDSFAHRAYHALPKTIRREDGGGAGAIVGFANFLLRLYEAERPRAVIVGVGYAGSPHGTPREIPGIPKWT
jgi:exodeoxyribonuclease-3